MTWPSSNGADGNQSKNDASEGDVNNARVDVQPMHSGMFEDCIDSIYASDSQQSEVPGDGTMLISCDTTLSTAQMAADLWLMGLELEEEASDDEFDGQSDSAGVPEPNHMAEFKPTPAEVAADLWLSEVEDVDEESDQEQEDSDEESGEESNGTMALESSDITKSKSALTYGGR